MRLWSRYATRVTQAGGRLSRQEQAFSAGWGELYIAAGILGHCATLLYSKALFQDGLVWCWGAEEERAEEAEVCSVFTRVSSTSARCPIYYQPFSTIPIFPRVHHTNLSFLLFLCNHSDILLDRNDGYTLDEIYSDWKPTLKEWFHPGCCCVSCPSLPIALVPLPTCFPTLAPGLGIARDGDISSKCVTILNLNNRKETKPKFNSDLVLFCCWDSTFAAPIHL